MMYPARSCLLACLLAAASACGGRNDTATRPFLMGFSPWPYAATMEAVDWTYATLTAEGELISHYMEECVPWPEMAGNLPFPAAFQAEINGRLARRVAGQRVLLQISPLDLARSNLAAYRGETEGMPLPPPWDGYALNDPAVITAFTRYANRMVEAFRPDSLLLGVEVNLLLRNNPAAWPAYLALHGAVYSNIKAGYPGLDVGVSVFSVPFFPQWSDGDDLAAQQTGLAALEPLVDHLAFSLHPFMSALLADAFPDDYCTQLFARTTKPVAVSESSYPAEAWSNQAGLVWHGSREKQQAVLDRMLAAAATAGARYFVWFAARDFDELWENTLGKSELALVWRDTGLFAADGGERMALKTWRAWLKRAIE